MPSKPKVKAPSPAQVKRAGRLRKLIADLEAGVRPANAPPKTPREITDEAARRREAASKKKG